MNNVPALPPTNYAIVQSTQTAPQNICHICGKKMIKRYANYVLTSYPPQYPWDWWCACGHTELGGVDRGQTDEEILKERWEQENRTR